MVSTKLSGISKPAGIARILNRAEVRSLVKNKIHPESSLLSDSTGVVGVGHTTPLGFLQFGFGDLKVLAKLLLIFHNAGSEQRSSGMQHAADYRKTSVPGKGFR